MKIKSGYMLSPKIKYIFTFIIFIFLFSSLNSYSQYYDLGQDPSRTKWKQIKTEHFQIIFPVGFLNEAQRLANLMDNAYSEVTRTLNFKPKRVPVIIHNRSIVSNAFSVWAPRRLEFYTCTPQSTYTQDWLQQLSLHELRHVVQMNMVNKGLTKFFTYLLGEQATAVVFGLYVPTWFMEGDAVCTETALSNSGRGRDPKFEMEMRTNILIGRNYSYDKAVLGSFKDFIPNEYNFGYLMVANARRRYGTEIWEKAVDNAGKNSWSITPFNKGIKKVSGLTKVKLYKQTIADLDSLWKQQMNKNNYTEFKTVSPQKNIYTNYQYPIYLNDSAILAVKSGFDDIPHLVVFKQNGKEKKIITPGFYNTACLSATFDINSSQSKNKTGEGPLLSACNNIIVWSEIQFDKRWAGRNYSVIKKYDLRNKKKTTLTRRTRLFAPSISPDGTKIATVEVTEDYKNSLVIIDANTGKEIKRFSTGSNDFYITPVWSDDCRQIAVINMNNKGKGILLIEADNLNFKTILKEEITEIYKLVFRKGYIFFNGIYSGISNIYAIDINTQKIHQVTSSKYGASDITISQNTGKIAYSDYTADGYNIVETDFNPSVWTPLENVGNTSIKLYEGYINQENKINFDTIKIKSYEVKNYSKTMHLFNFHSWMPFEYDNTELYPGIRFLSQNKLSTAFTILSYKYNQIENTNTYSLSFDYKGWYPVVGLKADYGNRRSHFVSSTDTTLKSFSWDELKSGIDLSLPLNFSSGNYYRLLEPSSGIGYINVSNSSLDIYTYDIKSFMFYNFGLYAYNVQKTVVRDMRPRFGQAISVNYKNAPDYYGEIFSVQSYFLFPGICRHHSTKISFEYQKNNSLYSGYVFENIINMPRGYTYLEDIYEIKKLSFDYKFPLLYPDLKISSLFYIKRLKLNLFTDYAFIDNVSLTRKEFNSCGAELTGDINIFRFFIPLDIGLRYSYVFSDNTYTIDLILALNLSNL
ncbi:MAG: hypothetical protein PHD97_06690 [Bacteroidales bacterium]|nr:hypothetical protein [Bacteroidales bacterium]